MYVCFLVLIYRSKIGGAQERQNIAHFAPGGMGGNPFGGRGVGMGGAE